MVLAQEMADGMITFTIPGKPESWQRANRNGKRTFDTSKNKSAKQTIGKAGLAAMVGRKPIQGPVRLKLAFMFDWPASYTKTRRWACYGNMKDTKPDIDNLAKMVMDGLNGIAWNDDAQVCEIHATKFFSQQETCTRVTIESLWEQAK